jgi:class 3 adenylate cyclase/pimeloyl-ACP methyl ester carboxylesterase
VHPTTKYASNGDVSIAYQVVGEGPVDLVFVPGFISHLDLWWTLPDATAFLRRLASFSRLILFDKRGTGLSDPVSEVPTLEERMEDVHAVLDAAGSERTALFGLSEGGPMSLLFAATYPERTTSLIMYGSFARLPTPSPPQGEREAEEARLNEQVDDIVDHWGEGTGIDYFAPSLADDSQRREGFALYERAAASPRMVQALFEGVREIDATPALSAIGVPTLVIHRAEDKAVPVEAGRYVAEHVPGARYVELTGIDHIPWVGDADSVLDEVEQFVTGTRRAPAPDRVLASVLFTDIVGSTQQAAKLGDRRWREVLEGHDELVRRELASHGGREVKSTGDGFLATFDGPAAAIRCACAIRDDVRSLGIEVRAGVHTGECEARNGDVGGMAVHIGARVSAQAPPGEVLVSAAVRDLVVGSGIEFAERGTHELKGVPGTWQLLAVAEAGPAVAGATPDADRLAPNATLTRRGDRAKLQVARRAPAAARLITRVAARRARRRGAERRGRDGLVAER